MDDRCDMNAIHLRLTRLRRSLRLWLFGVGLSRTLAVVAGFILFSLLIDRSARMDLVQRLLTSLVGWLAIGLMVWRWIIRPLRRRVGAEELLFRVERQRPELRRRLVSAWEFASMPEPPAGASPVLVAAAIEEGLETAKGMDFRGVLDWSRFWRRARLGGVALLALLVLGCGAPQMMRLWFSRNVLLSNVEWPRRTHLQVQGLIDGVLRAPVAGDLEFLVRAEGVQPEEVVFHYEDDAGFSYGEQMPLVGDVYRTVFRGVTAPFRLQASGGDDRTGWISVELLPRPEITDVAVSVEPPAYTGRKRTTLDARAGAYVAPAGSGVVLDGRASLPLGALEVTIEGDVLQALKISNAASFTIRLPPEQVKTATYRLQGVSSSGVPTRRPALVGLRVEPDRPPRVTASLDGVGSLILSRAVVPMACEWEDDYGVAAAWLEYQSQSPTGGSSSVIQAPLPLPEAIPGGDVVRLVHTLELGSLGLQTDDTISLRAVARDGNTLSGPGQTSSASFTLRVVTEEGLRQDFIQREQGLRKRLEGVIQEQGALADESRLFHASTETLRDQGASRYLQAEKRQRQIPALLASITLGLAQIRREAYNNRLESEPSALRKRLDDDLLAPLRDVAGTALPEAGDRVAAARQRTDETEREAAWRAAEDAQRRVISALTEVLKKMLASEDVSDLMRMIEDIVANQKNVNQETNRKANEAIEHIFEK